MRFRYFDPQNDAEAAERARAIATMDALWRGFEDRLAAIERYLAGDRSWDMVDWFRQAVDAVHRGLMWEFGPGPESNGTRGRMLIITPEHQTPLRPLVDCLLSRAPTLPGWTFAGYRDPIPVGHVDTYVKARTGGALDDVRVAVRGGDFRTIDLRFISPRYRVDDDQSHHEAVIAAEALLGEEMLEQWIGAIDAGSPDDDPPRVILALDRLRPTVEALVHSLREQLPDEPAYLTLDVADEQALLEMGLLGPLSDDDDDDEGFDPGLITPFDPADAAPYEPPANDLDDASAGDAFGVPSEDGLDEGDDADDDGDAEDEDGIGFGDEPVELASMYRLHPDESAVQFVGRDDLYVASTYRKDLWLAIHGGSLFFDHRFTRRGDVFCYIKLTHGGDESQVDRTKFEREVDDALRAESLGGVFASGAGLKHHYIDLALTDLTAAMRIVRDVLRKCGAPRQTWVLFFDDRLSLEWIGLEADTPAPLLPVID